MYSPIYINLSPAPTTGNEPDIKPAGYPAIVWISGRIYSQSFFNLSPAPIFGDEPDIKLVGYPTIVLIPNIRPDIFSNLYKPFTSDYIWG